MKSKTLDEKQIAKDTKRFFKRIVKNTAKDKNILVTPIE